MKGLLSRVDQKLSIRSLGHKTDFFSGLHYGALRYSKSLSFSVSVPNLHIRDFLRFVEYALLCVFRHS